MCGLPLIFVLLIKARRRSPEQSYPLDTETAAGSGSGRPLKLCPYRLRGLSPVGHPSSSRGELALDDLGEGNYIIGSSWSPVVLTRRLATGTRRRGFIPTSKPFAPNFQRSLELIEGYHTCESSSTEDQPGTRAQGARGAQGSRESGGMELPGPAPASGYLVAEATPGAQGASGSRGSAV